MKIVVTGATSFIGKAFVDVALEKGWEIVAVVRRNSPKAKAFEGVDNVSVAELNMDEYGKIAEAAGSFDCLAHFAWDGTRGAQRMDKELQQKNYENSVALIKAAIDSGCKRILTAGSQAEYGPQNGVITEQTECKPNTEYGVYKYKLFTTAGELCEKAGVSYKEPRFFSLYGPGDFEKTLIMSMIDNMRNNRRCELTECVQMWDFLYVKDAVRAVAALCELDCEDGAYNLGSGDVRELKAYVEELYSLLNSSSELVYGAVPYPETGMVSITPSVRKTQTLLNWKAEYSFADGIGEIIAAN